MIDATVTVIKNKRIHNINEKNLCISDLVIFQAGDIVPADIVLNESDRLEVDEFELTGEIMPVKKNVQKNRKLYKGSKIIKGYGKGIVTAVGDQTEYGQIIEQKWEQNGTLSFHIVEKKYFKIIVLILPAFITITALQGKYNFLPVLLIVLCMFLILLQNDDLFKYWIHSYGLKRLNYNRIEIRDQTALDSLSKIDVFCFDKTGVLTSRKMEVKSIYYAENLYNPTISNGDKISNLIGTACALCNDVYFWEKLESASAIDKALISFALNNDIDVSKIMRENKRIFDKPFDSEKRFMACGFQLMNKENLYYAKGDPDIILKICDDYIVPSGKKKISASFKEGLYKKIRTINQKGNVSIAMAYTTNKPDEFQHHYTLLCVIEFENPLQPDAQNVIEQMKERKIRSIMLTGDRAETAINIGKQSGMGGYSEACMTGSMINRMSFDDIFIQSAYCSIFAKLLPSQKGIIVQALRQRNHHIAMIGDGSNDAIALKVSDVGISYMVNSSPIARRLSKILISDLSDLLCLIDTADRIKRMTGVIKIIRVLILAVILTSSYLLALILIFHS